MVLYICVKFRENISNGIRVMERTQSYEALTDGRAFNFGRYNIITRHFFVAGQKKKKPEKGWVGDEGAKKIQRNNSRIPQETEQVNEIWIESQCQDTEAHLSRNNTREI